MVDDKPIEQFTFFEKNFIRPISVLFGVVGKANKAVNIGKKKDTTENQITRTQLKPVFNTDKEAEAAAKAMGYVKVNERSQNAAVFKKEVVTLLEIELDMVMVALGKKQIA